MYRGWLDGVFISSFFLSVKCGRVMVAPEATAAMKGLAREEGLGRLWVGTF